MRLMQQPSAMCMLSERWLAESWSYLKLRKLCASASISWQKEKTVERKLRDLVQIQHWPASSGADCILHLAQNIAAQGPSEAERLQLRTCSKFCTLQQIFSGNLKKPAMRWRIIDFWRQTVSLVWCLRPGWQHCLFFLLVSLLLLALFSHIWLFIAFKADCTLWI